MPFIQRRTLARIILAVVFAIVAVAAVVWFYRDLPRRRVERALAERLGAEVRLGRLTIEGTRRVVLHDLLVSRIAGKPWLDTVRIGELVATGGLTEMTAARYESLLLVDVEARLAQRRSGPPAAVEEEPAQLVAGRLDIERGALVAPALASSGSGGSAGGSAGGSGRSGADGAAAGIDGEAATAESRLEGEAHLTDVGGRLAGEVRLASSAPVRLGPWRAVFLGVPSTPPAAGSIGGAVEGLSATLTIDEGGNRDRIEARGRRLVLERAGRTVACDAPEVSIELRQDDPAKPMRVELRPRLAALFDQASLVVDLEPGTQDPVAGRIEIRGARLEPLLTLAGPIPLRPGTSGVADLDVTITGRNRAEYDLAARLPLAIVEGQGLSAQLRRTTIEARGTALLDPGSPGLTVAAALDLADGTGEWEGTALPADVLPARASLEGSIALTDPAPRFAGKLTVETAGAGRVEAQGEIDLPAATGVLTPRTATDDAMVSSLPPGTAAGSNGGCVGRSRPDARAGDLTPAASAAGMPPAAPAAGIDVRWEWTHSDLHQLAHLARALGAPIPDAFDATGRAAAAGTLAGSLAAPELHATLTLDPLAASYALSPAPLDRTGARRSASPPAGGSNEETDAARRARSFRSDGADRLSLSGARARGEIAWSVGRSPIRIRSLNVAGRAAIPPLAAFDGSLTASGQLDPRTGRASIDPVVLEAGGLARLTAKADADLGALAQAMAQRAQESSPGSNSSPGSSSSSGAITSTPPHLSPGRGESPGAAAAFTVTLDRIDLARWRAFLRPTIGDIAPGFEVKGTGQASFAGSVERDGRWKASGKAAIEKSGFSSEDGSQVLEGLDTWWDVEVTRSAADRPIQLEAKAIAGGFQLLWGSFFADAAKLGSTVEIAASLSPNKGSSSGQPAGSDVEPPPAPRGSWSARVAWAYPGGPRVEASFAADPSGAISYEAKAVVEDVGTTVERYVRGPLGDSVPFLAKVEAGGAIRAEAAGRFDDARRTVRGRIEARGLRVAGTKGFAEVNGLDLDLPVALAWDVPAGARVASAASASPDSATSDGSVGALSSPGDSHAASGGAAPPARVTGGPPAVHPLDGDDHPGRVRFSSLSIGELDIDAIETPLSVRGDTIRFHEGLAVPLFGGVLVLEDLSLIDLLQPSRRLGTGVVLSQLRVGDLTKAFALPPMQGEIEGSFKNVVLTPDALRVEGKGEIAIFGGTVRLGGLSGQEILSRYPKLTFSADFEEIDLGKLTKTFDFGEMTGLVRGYVHDCELFRDVPVRFEALLETVEKRGVSRRINVKAINNIAILGTGGNPGLLDRGIHKFLDSYTYDRIGISMSLRDDAFLIRGLIHEKGRELFLDGRLPFPINIINAQPGTVVSFSTMVDRVKALDVTTVKTSR